MNRKLLPVQLLLTIAATVCSFSLSAQYQKVNYAASVVSSTNTTDASAALGFHPASQSAFSSTVASLRSTRAENANLHLSFGVPGKAGDTIFVKLGNEPLGTQHHNLTKYITMQPYLNGALAGAAGTATDYSLTTLSGNKIADGKIVMYVAKADFNEVDIIVPKGLILLTIRKRADVREAYFKGSATAWPQDCDNPYETSTGTGGLTLGSFSNPYDALDRSNNREKTYSYMTYVGLAAGTVFTQEILFSGVGNETDEVRALVGPPIELFSNLFSLGVNFADQMSLQPYVDNKAVGEEQTVSRIIGLDASWLTSLYRWVTGTNYRPIYYKPGVKFNKLVFRWRVPFALTTVSGYAIYDARRVAAKPKIGVSGPINICEGATTQLTASTNTGETGLVYRWFSSDPKGDMNAQSLVGTGETYNVPSDVTAKRGRYVYYVGAVRTVCGNVMSDADSVVVNVFAKPKFINTALPEGTVGTEYTPTIIKTDSAAAYTVNGLPSGLSFNTATATISGTPTTAGSFSVTVTATPANGSSCPVTQEYVLKINVPLPVAYASELSAKVQPDNSVLLTWVTASEQNNKLFEVQRSKSANGNDWIKIGEVAGKAVNSSAGASYDFTDKDPANGVNIYRLVQKDLDGRSAISKYVTVTVEAGGNSVKVYPNPATTVITVTGVPASAVLKVMDMSGRILLTTTNSQVDIAKLAPGVYVIQVFVNGKPDQSLKFVKK